MKPLLIYKYERGMQKKSKEFFKLFMNQGDEIEKDFVEGKMKKGKNVAPESEHAASNSGLFNQIEDY